MFGKKFTLDDIEKIVRNISDEEFEQLVNSRKSASGASDQSDAKPNTEGVPETTSKPLAEPEKTEEQEEQEESPEETNEEDVEESVEEAVDNAEATGMDNAESGNAGGANDEKYNALFEEITKLTARMTALEKADSKNAEEIGTDTEYSDMPAMLMPREYAEAAKNKRI
jgi:flagellar biosynthesis/type III secretory pathway protein FliH